MRAGLHALGWQGRYPVSRAHLLRLAPHRTSPWNNADFTKFYKDVAVVQGFWRMCVEGAPPPLLCDHTLRGSKNDKGDGSMDCCGLLALQYLTIHYAATQDLTQN